MKFIRNKKLWPIFFFILTIVTYWPVLRFDFPVNPDAQYVYPLLIKINSIHDYIHHLFTYRTLDFQPVRDLSFYIDLVIYKYWKLNSSVIQNIILWTSGVLIVGRLIKKTFTTLQDMEIFFILLGFLVYPLFTQTVSWGIARKHLLAFVFISLSTSHWLENKGQLKIRNSIYATFFYMLSVLSQPITLLWPFWALVQNSLSTSGDRLKRLIIHLLPTFLILGAVGFWNYTYYSKSPIFAQIYGTKTDELFEISDKVLALGHYLFQLLFPYILSFTYTLGHWSVLAGLLLIGILTLIIIRLKLDYKFIVTWFIFSIIPIVVIITKSRTLYDTYLLVPSLGLLFILLAIKEKLPTFRFKYFAYIVITLFWMVFSNHESIAWTDEILMTQRSFERRPHCLSAYQFLRMSYENGKPPKSDNAKKFMYNHRCESFEVGGQGLINLQAYLLYYEDDFVPEERLKKLQNISSNGLLPSLALAALYLKLKKHDETNKTLDHIYHRWGKTKYRDEYIPIVRDSIYPYCLGTQHLNCIEMMKPFLEKPVGIIYK